MITEHRDLFDDDALDELEHARPSTTTTTATTTASDGQSTRFNVEAYIAKHVVHQNFYNDIDDVCADA